MNKGEVGEPLRRARLERMMKLSIPDSYFSSKSSWEIISDILKEYDNEVKD